MLRYLLVLLLPLRLWANEADELASRGEFAKAAAAYLDQARREEKHGRFDVAVPALMNAASCMKMSGDVSAAALHLTQARKWMGEKPPAAQYLEWLALKGSVLALGKRPSEAAPVLREALVAVNASTDVSLVTSLFNDLGIALSSAGKHAEAMECFVRADQLAQRDGNGANLLRARQNHLVAAFQAWAEADELVRRIEEVGSWPGDAVDQRHLARARLDASLAAAIAALKQFDADGFLALHLRLTAAMAAHRSGSVAVANELFASALEQARTSGGPQFEASALLGLAEQYVDARRDTEALQLLDQARNLIPRLEKPEIARLEVLTALARHALAPADPATGDAIRRAVLQIGDIRSDLARSQMISDLGRGFRDFAGRPYLLLADYLLRGKDNSQQTLRDARDALESFKTWELNDFYRDDCVNLVLSKARDLDRIGDPTVAVVYVIPLEDRTELLIGHDRGLYRFTSDAGSAVLLAAARRFRYRLESDYGTYRYLDDAEFLHHQLIEPALGKLRELGVRHLVFVPDGALGNIPLGALVDHSTGRYLLEEFSLSIAPNLSLLEPPAASRKAGPLLLGGLSTATQGFPAIPSVAREVDGIAPLYPDHRVLRDKQFTSEAIEHSLIENPVDVVHLASHGEFLGRAENCYLLTNDGRITLDQIEKMIRPRKFVETPVSLLCLSACRTAAGDDRAALGLAGATVKSGARSVLATLWYIEDQSTAGLMTSFHRHLRTDGSGNKADALRRAQLDVLHQDPNAHPSLWAPFVLVGSWR